MCDTEPLIAKAPISVAAISDTQTASCTMQLPANQPDKVPGCPTHEGPILESPGCPR